MVRHTRLRDEAPVPPGLVPIQRAPSQQDAKYSQNDRISTSAQHRAEPALNPFTAVVVIQRAACPMGDGRGDCFASQSNLRAEGPRESRPGGQREKPLSLSTLHLHQRHNSPTCPRTPFCRGFDCCSPSLHPYPVVVVVVPSLSIEAVQSSWLRRLHATSLIRHFPPAF